MKKQIGIKKPVPSSTGGSVGAVWPPTVDTKPLTDNLTGDILHRGNDRVKGFYPNIIQDKNELRLFMDELIKLFAMHDVSRLTVRAIIPNTLLSGELYNLLNYEKYSPIMNEARISLSGVFPGHSLAYLALNRNSRFSNTPDIINNRSWVSIIMQRQSKTEAELLRIVNSNGYAFDTQFTEQDISNLVSLYNLSLPRYLMVMDNTTVESMLSNPDNQRLFIRNHEGIIISSAMAEHAHIPLSIDKNSGVYNLHIAEMSECVTLPNYRGQGLMSAILYKLIQDMNIGTVVYSESRAPHKPINISMRNNGLNYTGTINKHCVIGDNTSLSHGSAFSQMEDLHVWALVKR